MAGGALDAYFVVPSSLPACQLAQKGVPRYVHGYAGTSPSEAAVQRVKASQFSRPATDRAPPEGQPGSLSGHRAGSWPTADQVDWTGPDQTGRLVFAEQWLALVTL